MLLSRQGPHARAGRSILILGISDGKRNGNRAVPRTPATPLRSSLLLQRRSSASAAVAAASTTLTSTSTSAAAVLPSPPLLPTTSPFDPSLETLRPARSSNPRVLVREGFWEWEGHRIRYTRAGFGDDDEFNENGDGDDKNPTSSSSSSPSGKRPLLVCVHGFGGNADHWRKNVPELAQSGCRVAAIDLLGYGYSSKPDPKKSGGRGRSGKEARNKNGDGNDDGGDKGTLSSSSSSSPLPLLPPNQVYSMEAWARQLLDFIKGPCGGGSAFLITNSIGGIAALQAAVFAEEEEEENSNKTSSSASSSSSSNPTSLIAGVQLMDVSLRMLHTTKQPPLARPLVSALQTVLRETAVGELFFGAVAKPQTVSKILKEAYGDPETVDDELVEAILKPGLEPGATQVFLDFISMSGGPLPELLLSQLKSTPVSILWGEKDPWEKLEWGRELAAQAAGSEELAREWRAGRAEGNGAVTVSKASCVEEFEVLKGVGHCPQDEAPGLVNPLTLRFVRRHHK